MKTVIIYYSKHHGNTKKLLDAIEQEHEVALIDAIEKAEVNLTGYDRIGFASGIYYSSFAKQLLSFASVNLPPEKDVFFISTCGAPRSSYFDAIRKVTKEKGCRELGTYQCLGFDTFGPFKMVGGIAKGHPTKEEIQGAVGFYKKL